ncbi:MAG: glutamate formimidoyltransferase [bacterium]|nr:glutamate formimidoyltransferase [bacterium]
MPRRLQSVPNFSEGRREGVVRDIIEAATTPGLKVLDWSSDPDHNRSVVTVVGEPEAVLAGLRAMTARAVSLIDLRTHRGSHPRMGAMDVVPLIPLLEMTMDEAVALADRLARELAAAHDLPVYLYGEAATRPAHRDLSRVREGQFEGLAAVIGRPERRPDYGPARLHPTAGATAVGARGPLVAFNVNLSTPDVAVAKRIARQIRESGGGLPAVRAIGLALAGRDETQVSMNLVDFRRTSLGVAYRAVAEAAAAAGVGVTSSEIVGLAPAEALLAEAAGALRLAGFSSGQVLELRLLEEDEAPAGLEEGSRPR